MEKYIETTILSVISQNYPNLEYIIIDGGSTDNTRNIVNRYRDKISVAVSEKDDGMYDAISKGFNMASGDLLAWLNADDHYFAWTLKTVGRIFSENNSVKWLCGASSFLSEEGMLVRVNNNAGAKSRKDIKNGWFKKEIYNYLQQESMFFRREVYRNSGGLQFAGNGSYRYAADFKLWMNFAEHYELVSVNLPLAAFRRRADSLSTAQMGSYRKELQKACAGKPEYPNVLWRIIPKNFFFICLMRVFTLRKTEMCSYSFEKQRYMVKNILRSISSNTLTDLYYEFKFRK
jgi:glycosyltransferase involved in cell wall biosynthesis